MKLFRILTAVYLICYSQFRTILPNYILFTTLTAKRI